MIARFPILLGVVVAAAALAIVMNVGAHRAAAARRDGAERRLAVTVAAVRELAELRSREETVAAGRRPERDIIARVNATLDAAGLDRALFRNQIPEADAAVPGPAGAVPRRRQAVRLAIGPVTAAQLGAFLAEWRSAHPAWTPIAVDLTHRGDATARAGRVGAAHRDGGVYDATVVIAAIYAEFDAPSAPADGSVVNDRR